MNKNTTISQSDKLAIRAMRERMLVPAAHKQDQAPGNAAALHEALEMINRINTGELKRLLAKLVEADIFDGGLINTTISIVEKARAALAAPARNCDTLSDALDAINTWRNQLPPRYVRDPTVREFANWLFAPEEGGKK